MAWPDLDSQLVHLLCERRPDLDYASNGAPRGTTGIMAWPALTRRLLTTIASPTWIMHQRRTEGYNRHKAATRPPVTRVC